MITAAVKIMSVVTTATTMITTGRVVAPSLWGVSVGCVLVTLSLCRVLVGCILLLLTVVVVVALGIDVPCEVKHKT